MVEANDMAAVGMLADAGLAFVGGPTLNIYNSRTVAVLARQGMTRWVLPFELCGTTAAELVAAAPDGCPCEVFAWGRLPLAWSARCFTARAEDRPKDHCELACIDDTDGRLVRTREQTPFLVLNGIQIQSALTQDLAPVIHEMNAAGIDSLRLSPQSQHMAAIVARFDALRCGASKPGRFEELAEFAPLGTCNGYWRGTAGFDGSQPASSARTMISAQADASEAAS